MPVADSSGAHRADSALCCHCEVHLYSVRAVRSRAMSVGAGGSRDGNIDIIMQKQTKPRSVRRAHCCACSHGVAAPSATGLPAMMAAAGSSAPVGGEVSLYVGDLGPDITDNVLLATFQARFPTARSAKVIMDGATGMSKGCGAHTRACSVGLHPSRCVPWLGQVRLRPFLNEGGSGGCAGDAR